MLLYNIKQAIAYSHLTEIELKQLYRRFRHPFIRRLVKVLDKAGYTDVNSRIIERLTKFYK